MDCGLPSLMLMMILCSTQFSNAQSPGRCQCHKPVKSVKPRQIATYSITRPTVNCNAYEIRIWLKGEKTASCLDPYVPLAKTLLSCMQRYGYNAGHVEICLCKHKNYTNPMKCRQRFRGSHIMLRSLDK
ncbi:C-X-C motif chemokine 11-like [Mustelus asterias]